MDDGRREPGGPRRAALEERRQRKRRKMTAWGTAATVLGVAAGTTGLLLLAREATRPSPAPGAVSSVAPEEVTTALFVGTRRTGAGERLAWLTLMSLSAEDRSGTIAYVPGRTSVEVPGRGMQTFSDAYGTGDAELLLVTVENLFGIPIEHLLEVGEDEAESLFSEVGPLTVDVPADVRVPAGPEEVRVIFSAGQQSLAPSMLVRLLYTPDLEDDEVSLGVRHVAFWNALLGSFRSDPDALEHALLSGGDALGDAGTGLDDVARMLGRLAAHADDVSLRTLTVSPVDVPGSSIYVAEEEDVADLVAEVAGRTALADPVRVQILNGNGEPGIGEEVAALLVGEGFRVTLSGNARSLDHETSLVVGYGTGEEARAMAERARELLGVGEIRISTQRQGIVDVTIVVGKDFLRTR